MAVGDKLHLGSPFGHGDSIRVAQRQTQGYCFSRRAHGYPSVQTRPLYTTPGHFCKTEAGLGDYGWVNIRPGFIASIAVETGYRSPCGFGRFGLL